MSKSSKPASLSLKKLNELFDEVKKLHKCRNCGNVWIEVSELEESTQEKIIQSAIKQMEERVVKSRNVYSIETFHECIQILKGLK